ncbi:MAG: hypothetical protein WBL81_19150, partial [Pseudolabrys sp.]
MLDRFLEKWDYNGKAKTFSNRFNGHSIFVSDDNLDPKDGLLFGSMLGQQLKARKPDICYRRIRTGACRSGRRQHRRTLHDLQR